MKRQKEIHTEDLERRGVQLTIFACFAILVLAAGLAVLMYSAVIPPGISPINGASRTAFFGYCVLSALLVAYIVDRQLTIARLRSQITGDRKKAMAAQDLASRELLKTLPNFSSFQDRLPMEFRRAATSSQELSILIIHIQIHQDFSAPSTTQTAFGDAAKAIARKLRDQDSIYILQMHYFAVILPGLPVFAAKVVSSRISEGLMDVAGTTERLSSKIDIINYPEHASTANELETSICALMPDERSQKMIAAEVST